ncbi:MAG: hypothetical protein AAFQ43_11130, partial [Bacteroidota bacterium]
MRLLLFLALLLAASGARAQDLAAQIVGEWANADSIAYPLVLNGEEVGALDGRFATLYLHVSVTDSTYTLTSVVRDDGDLLGYETARPYVIHGDSIAVRGSSAGGPVPVKVRGDTLALMPPGEASLVYTRAGPLAPPEALVGDWISETLTDDAGVVFDLAFRFRADGTMQVGASDEPLAYRVLGSYLLIEDTTFEDPSSGAVVT